MASARGDAYTVYFLASRKHGPPPEGFGPQGGTLYIGVTNDIAPRTWKIRLIERANPEWEDLYDRLNG